MGRLSLTTDPNGMVESITEQALTRVVHKVWNLESHYDAKGVSKLTMDIVDEETGVSSNEMLMGLEDSLKEIMENLD